MKKLSLLLATIFALSINAFAAQDEAETHSSHHKQQHATHAEKDGDAEAVTDVHTGTATDKE